MDKEQFIKYIENDRDCSIDSLDIAINKGLRKAKNDRIDNKKLFLLAAACLFTLIICFSINLGLFNTDAVNYYQYWHKALPGTAEILDLYQNDITTKIMIFLGGI